MKALPHGSSPFQGPGLSRRAFLELSAGGLVASWFLGSPASAFARATSLGVTPRGTAKNCLLLWMPGAPSQTDTWDLKEGSWTPAAFAPTTYGGDLRFPQGLLPKIAEQLPRVTLVRSYMAWALVHGLAQTWAQIARNPTGATGSIAPNVGAVVALEMQARRAPTDVLPAFVALNGASVAGAGYFPSACSPFAVQPSTTAGEGLPSLSHPDGAERFAARWSDLQAIDARLRSGEAFGKEGSDMAGFYTQAKAIMDTPEVNALFTYTEDEHARYGATSFGDSCCIARKLVAGRRGTRFVQVTLGGWDMHSNIYGANGNSLFTVGRPLDDALGALLADLAAAPGETPGKSLLDETLVLVLGEFGRTVGSLNGQAGRDHFMRTAFLAAGGGVRGGQAVGATDATGAGLLDSGWSESREIRPEDLAATLYSALGIDWTTVRHDDPLGRGFEYVPYASQGTYKPVEALFV